jgi:opacity protein-like surface antigen
MRSVVCWALSAVVMLLAVAAVHGEDPVGVISLGGSAGMSGYGLGDVNRRIQGPGAEFVNERGWTPLDPIRFGWTFLGDVKYPVPMTRSFFVSAGYGVSSGSSGGRDYNELLSVDVSQTAYHARLLYVLPWRFHRNVRLFVDGGPLFIKEQKVEASHTHRSSAGGSQEQQSVRLEKVTYSGSGIGWQIGTSAEYMVQDRVTLCFDLGYRHASVDYKDWNSMKSVTISETGGAGSVGYEDGTFSDERLSLTSSYVGHAFLDWTGTEQQAEVNLDNTFLDGVAGPYIGYLKAVDVKDMGIDLSGIQFHLGLRLYFF